MQKQEQTGFGWLVVDQKLNFVAQILNKEQPTTEELETAKICCEFAQRVITATRNKILAVFEGQKVSYLQQLIDYCTELYNPTNWVGCIFSFADEKKFAILSDKNSPWEQISDCIISEVDIKDSYCKKLSEKIKERIQNR